MTESSEAVQLLKKLFRGRQDAYGVIINGEEKCIRETLTENLIQQHLVGKKRK